MASSPGSVAHGCSSGPTAVQEDGHDAPSSTPASEPAGRTTPVEVHDPPLSDSAREVHGMVLVSGPRATQEVEVAQETPARIELSSAANPVVDVHDPAERDDTMAIADSTPALPTAWHEVVEVQLTASRVA
jgi:hypothetical protein